MSLPRSAIALAVLAAAVLSGSAAYAVTNLANASGTRPAAVTEADFQPGSATTVFLEADLNGRNEQVRGARSAMGDPHATAVEILRITGNQVAFEITWQNLAAPTIANLHSGAEGTAGPSVMPMMTAPMPATVTAIAGSVTSNNARLLAQLVTDPGRFYLNLGNTGYPGGAVRGQFRRIAPVDFQRITHTGPFAALADNGQVVSRTPSSSVDARATTFLGFGTSTITYAVSWTGFRSPTSATVNQGAVGANGPALVTLFAAPRGADPAITAVAGTVAGVPARTIAAMTANPAMFYTNLTTAKAPGGIARGQLFLTTPPTTTPPTTMPTTPPSTTPPTTAPTTMPTTMPTTTPPMTSTPTQPGGNTPAPPHW